MSRTLWLLLAALLALSVAIAPAADAAKKRRKSACERLEAAHRDQSPHRKLVLVVRGDSDVGNISACVLPRGKVRRLARWDDGLGRDGWGLVATSGYYVLAESSWGDQYGGTSRSLHRFDARTGRGVTLAGYGCHAEYGQGCTSGTSHGKVVLAPSGSGALELTDLATSTTTLQSFDRAGALAKLDDGPVEALRLAGREIVWTRQGAQRRAPLP